MLSDAGLKLLVRSEPLSLSERARLLDARRELIRPCLEKMSLTELGQVEWLRMGLHGKHALNIDDPKLTGGPAYSLKTLGIFGSQLTSKVDYKQTRADMSGTRVLWGLGRDGDWLLGDVHYVLEPGHKGRGYERATELYIRFATAFDILVATGQDLGRILEELRDAITRWRQRREQLLKLALDVEASALAEDRLLCALHQAAHGFAIKPSH